MSNIAATNAGIKYITDMNVSYLSTTTLTVGAGACRDSQNHNDIVLDDDVVLNAAVNGAGGLDTGDLENNTFYNVFALYDSTKNSPTDVILSKAAAPALPSDYDSYRLLAHGILTDGSAHFLPFRRVGNGLVREQYYDTLISELSAGTSTTFADVNVASSVPIGNTIVIFQANMTPATADNQLKLRSKDSSSTNGSVQVYGCVASKVSSAQVRVPCDEDKIVQYLVSNGSDAATLLTAGFVDVL